MTVPRKTRRATAKSKTVRRGKSASSLLKKRLHVRNRQGLHARPAALFCRVANRFRASVRVRRGGRVVDGKSIIGLLTLAASRGSFIDVTARGSDAQEMMQALEQVVSRAEPPAIVTILKHRSAHGS